MSDAEMASLTGWPEHAEHGPWKRTKPCVYCACGTRLYNGTAPTNIQEQREMAAAMESLFVNRKRNED